MKILETIINEKYNATVYLENIMLSAQQTDATISLQDIEKIKKLLSKAKTKLSSTHTTLQEKQYPLNTLVTTLENVISKANNE